MNRKEELRSITKGTRAALENLRSHGIKELPISRKKKEPQGLNLQKGSKAEILEPTRQKALVCQLCRLAKTRHSVVFGEGSLDATIVFVGEGPGRDEDEQGHPFVGAAGQLLTKMIQAMGFKREEVYIANVVKCRPPMNRPPQPDEVEACSPYLEAQLTTIHPKMICVLGRTAAAALLQTEAPMSSLRGKTFEWKGIPLIATFHPAYLLRNPPAKSLVWADLQRILEHLKNNE